MQGFLREMFLAALLTAALAVSALLLHHFDLLMPSR